MPINRRPGRFSAAVFVPFVFLAVSGIAHAQSYGEGDQVTTVPAAAFRPLSGSNTTYAQVSGYLYGQGSYAAGVSIPDGAIVTRMCVYANDPNDPSEVEVALQEVGLAAGGQVPHDFTEIGLLTADFDIGYGVACQDTAGYGWRDLDLAGINVTHYFFVNVIGDAALGGVQLTWHRTVSPPPGTPTFNDVPASDGFFPFVEALVASGITAGCGGGNYCPDAPLTRRQMAAFLSKALGLHWPY